MKKTRLRGKALAVALIESYPRTFGPLNTARITKYNLSLTLYKEEPRHFCNKAGWVSWGPFGRRKFLDMEEFATDKINAQRLDKAKLAFQGMRKGILLTVSLIGSILNSVPMLSKIAGFGVLLLVLSGVSQLLEEDETLFDDVIDLPNRLGRRIEKTNRS